MGKRRRRTRLLKKTLPSFGIRTQFRGEKFKRDRPLQLHILGFINNPHAAVTNLFEDAVFPGQQAAEGNSRAWSHKGLGKGRQLFFGSMDRHPAFAAEAGIIQNFRMTLRAHDGHLLPSPVTWPEDITSDANRSMARWWKTWRA